jgi:hypothetical protein
MCDGTPHAPDITSCDDQKVYSVHCPVTPTPTPSGCPPPPFCLEGLDGGSCNTPVDWCRYPFNGGCPDDYIANSCCCLFVGSLDTGDCGSSFGFGCDVAFVGGCENPYYGDPIYCGPSPLLIDVNSDGFSLTDAAGGVNFDLNNDGVGERVSWTAAGSDDAWLAFDRNHNGVIDSGRELFGNYTPQPLADPPNGLQALSVFDAPARGGNADGVIDAHDAVFAYLRLWQDSNHDGISQPAELHTLPELDVARIHLDYKESKRTDEFGNRFRYRAKVDDAKGAKAGRWAWDVFLGPGQ